MDAMDQVKPVATLEEAQVVIQRLYDSGFEAYVTEEGGQLVVKWNEYQ